jgi:hypothetical protein
LALFLGGNLEVGCPAFISELGDGLEGGPIVSQKLLNVDLCGVEELPGYAELEHLCAGGCKSV